MAILPYATFEDFCSIKDITPGKVSKREARTIRDYLGRATEQVAGITRRRFFPFQETRRYSLPSNYIDLRQRAFPRNDLMLDQDLLEIQRVQVGLSNAGMEMSETLPSGGLSVMATTFVAINASGLDSSGVSPRISIGDILVIGNELCPVVNVNYGTNLVQIQRGAFDTVAQSHVAGTDVQKIPLVTLQPGVDVIAIDFNVRPVVGLRIVWPATWAGRFTGSTWQFRYPQIYITGLWGYHERKNEWWVNTLQTVPSPGFDATTAIWTPSALSATDETGDLAVEDGYLYRIDDELIWGATIAAGQQMLIRGRHGTTAVAHAASAPIYRFAVMSQVAEATIDIAKTLRDQDESVGGRQGVSDVSIGIKIGFTDTTKSTIARLVRSTL